VTDQSGQCITSSLLWIRWRLRILCPSLKRETNANYQKKDGRRKEKKDKYFRQYMKHLGGCLSYRHDEMQQKMKDFYWEEALEISINRDPTMFIFISCPTPANSDS
jgi:hypothetical protein